MPTKTQAKAAVDAAAVDAKSDIDNILPAGVNIKDGSIGFGPESYVIELDAGGSATTALTLLGAVQTNLTSAGRSFTTFRSDRRVDDGGKKVMGVKEAKLTVVIINFG